MISRRLMFSILALPGMLGATAYYVSPTGNDLDPGSLALPWKTVAPVNAKVFSAGDQVYFGGGQTFAGGLNFNLADSGAAGNPVVVGSYGVGRATIAPVASGVGVTIQDTEWIELQDLIIKGVGASSTKDGIFLRDSSASNRQHFWVRNCDIYGFGGSGLFVVAGMSTGGYHDVSVTASDFHNNKGCGVNFDGNYWDTNPRPHGNFYFGGCSFYNNITSGLILVEMSGALVEHCLAHDNGPSSGCIGFWCWDADHIVFQYCESHHNTRTAGGSDGGGFDLDGATRDSVLQYNYSHDNDGGGFALYQFGWAELSGLTINNIIRYNVSENDGRKGGYGGISMYGDGNFSGQPAPGDWVEYTEIYNNTIYTSSPATAAVEFIFNFQKNILFYNNIFYNSNVADFIHRGAGSDDGSIIFRNNAYWRPGGTFRVDFDGVVYNSLAAWRGSGNAKQEMEGATPLGFNVDPLLNAPGTGGIIFPALLNTMTAYLLQPGSPMRDTALDLSTRLVLTPVPGSQDFWGNSLPQGPAYDIGAHEPTPPPSPTPSMTASPTATFSESPTAMGTYTASPTLTPSCTISPTSSMTPSSSPTPTDVALRAAPTLAFTDSRFILQRVQALPNPQSGPLFGFAMQLTRPAVRVSLTLYSASLTLIRQAEGVPGGWYGWQQVSVMLPELSNGLYFYQLEIEDSMGRKIHSRVGKLFVAQ